MKIELDIKLCKKYPKIFAQRHLPATETAMCWGFDCGDGWYWLIDNLCNAIQNYVDCRNEGVRIINKAKNKFTRYQKLWYKIRRFFHIGGRNYLLESKDEKDEREWQVEAVQVKEKYGGLRFYISGGDDIIHGMIDLAEKMSYQICEKCGSRENVKQTKGGWISTLCSKCKKKLE